MRVVYILILFCVHFVSSLNFVVYLNAIGKSHVNYVAALIDLLIARGHNVDLLLAKLNTAFDFSNATNARNVISFGFPEESPWMKTKHLTNPFEHLQPFDMGRFFQISTDLCRVGLESGEPLKFLQEGNYDAILVSQYEYCGLILAKAAGISSVIAYTATNMMPTQAMSLGLPNSPNCVTGNLDADRGTFDLWGRLTRFYYWNKFYWLTRVEGQGAQTALAREFFGSNFPEIEELERNVDLVLINSNEIIEIPRTVSHKVVYIGGVAQKPPKPINKEFSELLSKSSKGNVLISFGTQVPCKTIPRRVKEAIVYSADHFKDHTFLFKCEQEEDDFEIVKNSPNLHLLKWLPQADLLHDGKIDVFVSHMGLNSLLEASSAGVPIVSIPLFADQGHNARCAARIGMAVILEKSSFTGKELAEALATILTNKSFKDNAVEISRMLKDKPDDMKNRFVEWAEFIARHKNAHKIFNLPEAKASFIMYYCLDLVFYFSLLVLLGFYISYKILIKLQMSFN